MLRVEVGGADLSLKSILTANMSINQPQHLTQTFTLDRALMPSTLRVSSHEFTNSVLLLPLPLVPASECAQLIPKKVQSKKRMESSLMRFFLSFVFSQAFSPLISPLHRLYFCFTVPLPRFNLLTVVGFGTGGLIWLARQVSSSMSPRPGTSWEVKTSRPPLHHRIAV